MLWMWIWLVACRPDPGTNGASKSTSTTPTTTTTTTTSSTSSTPSETQETAWWVDTGDSDSAAEGSDSAETEDTAKGYNPYPFYPYTTSDSALDTGYFLDSGIPDCGGEPQLEPVTLPSTRLEDEDASAQLPDADLDGDGFVGADDCDDLDPMVFPGASERCDGVDTDCEPTTSEDGLVTLNGLDTFTSWRDAAAASAPGDIMVLCPGVHEGPVWMRHDVTMVGLEGPEVTVLSAGPSQRNLLRMQQGDLLLEGLTVSGANVDGVMVGTWLNEAAFWPRGAGVSLGKCGSLVARNVIFEDNVHYGEGGAVGSLDAPVYLFDCTLRRNQAAAHGAIRTSGPLHLERVVVEDNICEAEDHVLFADGDLFATDLTLADNLGGGLRSTGTTAVLEGLVATGNEQSGSREQAGAAWFDNESTQLVDCLVEGNTCLQGPGGVALHSTLAVVDTCDFVGNVGDHGGGLAVSGSAIFGDVLVAHNTANEGGGVHQTTGDVYAADLVVEGNDAVTGGGLFVEGTWAGGTVRQNVAEYGGGVVAGDRYWSFNLASVVIEDNEATVLGGGFYCKALAASVESTWFSGNMAPLGPMGAVANMDAGWFCTDCERVGEAVVHAPVSGTDWPRPGSGDFICGGAECTDWPTVDDVGFERSLIHPAASIERVVVGSEHILVLAEGADPLTLREVDGSWVATEVPLVASGIDAADTDGDLLVTTRWEQVDVYRWHGEAWVHEASLLPSVPRPEFGDAVATDGTTIAVGDPGREVAGEYGSGGVHIFEHDEAAGWTQSVVLTHTPNWGAGFGWSVVLESQRLVVGADRAYAGAPAASDGRLVLHEPIGGVWTETQVHSPLDEYEELGLHLALGNLVVGGHGHWTNDDGGFRAWGLDGTLVASWDDAELYGAPTITSMAMEGDLLVMGFGDADDIANETGWVAVFPTVSTTPVRLFDLGREAWKHLGAQVGVRDRVVFATDVDGLWRFEPDDADPAW